MSTAELILLAISLSMDAFAVSICKGLAAKKLRLRDALTCGIWFGAFQAIMPTAGYFLGIRFADMIRQLDHWIAFFLLAFLGINMVRESFKEEKTDDSFCPRAMFPLAIATSIDALAVGVTFAFLSVHLVSSVMVIGASTFIISTAGALLGRKLGEKFGAISQRIGGFVLIAIGAKILIEHLFFGG